MSKVQHARERRTMQVHKVKPSYDKVIMNMPRVPDHAPEVRQAARVTVVRNAHDRADAIELLRMLGLVRSNL